MGILGSSEVIAAAIGAAAVILAAALAAVLSRSPDIKIELGDGGIEKFHAKDVDAAINALKKRTYSYSGSEFTLQDVMLNALHIMKDYKFFSADSVRAESFPKIANALKLEPSNFGDETAQANLLDRILMDLTSMNIIREYRADSQYHNVQTLLITNFGSAVSKALALRNW